jgi:hypothetical protein
MNAEQPSAVHVVAGSTYEDRKGFRARAARKSTPGAGRDLRVAVREVAARRDGRAPRLDGHRALLELALEAGRGRAGVLAPELLLVGCDHGERVVLMFAEVLPDAADREEVVAPVEAAVLALGRAPIRVSRALGAKHLALEVLEVAFGGESDAPRPGGRPQSLGVRHGRPGDEDERFETAGGSPAGRLRHRSRRLFQ